MTQGTSDRWTKLQRWLGIQSLLSSRMLNELSRWRHQSPLRMLELLKVILGRAHDKTMAEGIGQAVLEVTVELSAEA
jgi:hypothetical protein